MLTLLYSKEEFVMNSYLKLIAPVALPLLLAGCAHRYPSYYRCCDLPPPGYSQEVLQPENVATPLCTTVNCRQPPPPCATSDCVDDVLVISVTGYGAPKSTFENLAQRRLMAMRASELDAYRKLAEQIAGVHLFGSTSVNDYIAGRDRVRTRVDSYIRGAAIVNQEFEEDGMAVTTMSLKASKSRLRRMLDYETYRYHSGGNLLPGGAYGDHGFFAPPY